MKTRFARRIAACCVWTLASGTVLPLLLGGCATTPAAPDGAAGYVLFYGSVQGEERHRDEGIVVREVTGGRKGRRYALLLMDETQVRLLPAIPRPGQGIFQKIACAPGQHLFRLQKDETMTQVMVDVAEGMITPVPVTMTIITRDDAIWAERAFYILTAAPEAPQKPPVEAFGRKFE